MKQYDAKKIRRTLSKYDTKKVQVHLQGDLQLSMTTVVDSYALLDKMAEQEAQQKRSERFPYWAEIWPTSLALANWFYTEKLEKSDGWVCELGCGLGLVGIVLAKSGWRVEATDFVEDALVFSTYNAQQNKVSGLYRVAYLDWRNPVGEQWGCLLASDVVYEKKNHRYLERVLRKLLTSGGKFYLADPQRKAAADFVELLVDQGYGHRQQCLSQNWQAMEQKVDIHIFTKP